jgi:uncharacterized protein
VDRLFLDANILFSASYREDTGVAMLWSLRKVTLFSSPYAIAEAERNLVERQQKQRLERLIQPLHVVQATTVPAALRREIGLSAKDWPIVGGAIAAEATHLLTGDLKHFGRYFGKHIHGILVLPPADYIRDATRTGTLTPPAS